jgi:methionyl-tRNA formyltransferase
VQYAIWQGDTRTGVTTQWMAEKLDAGDVILQRGVAIEPQETAGELFARLTPLGAGVLRDTLRLLENGEAPRAPQDESAATIAPTIKKEQGRIAWQESAQAIARQVRALDPWPVAWCEWNGAPLKIWRARVVEYSAAAPPGSIVECKGRVLVAAGAGALELQEVQAAGRPRLPAADWARGARLEAGQRFS